MSNDEFVSNFLWCIAIAAIFNYFSDQPFLVGLPMAMLGVLLGIPTVRLLRRFIDK